ncbi:conserved hypothetical protein [Mesorhizobium sp. STM 4661]|nr:conserved hypothetical protein [Mesorhizobium sp. STM 4661]
MDRDNKRARAAASSSQDVGNRSTLRDLPYGPLTDVAERLVSANPRDTARNLGTFKELGRRERIAVRGTRTEPETDLAKFETRTNQLGRSAVDLGDKLTAGLGHTSDEVALEQFRAVSNVSHYLRPETQDSIVNRIGNMDPPSQAIGALYAAQNFSKFNAENKARIFDQAAELATDPDGHVRSTASNAMYAMYHQLDPNQQAQAHSIPGMQDILPQMPPPRHAAEERSADLDAHIAGIGAAVRDTVGPQTSHEQLQRGGQVGRDISHSYNHAREDLMEARRSRDRTGR